MIDLRGAHLEGADLQNARLQSGLLNNTVLKQANLENADLRWANLLSSRHNMTLRLRTNSEGNEKNDEEILKVYNTSMLEGSSLKGANLSSAKMHEDSLEQAFGDGSTILSESTQRPNSWPQNSLQRDDYESQKMQWQFRRRD